jgi:two-component system nitrogen regulation response regulator GlnG
LILDLHMHDFSENGASRLPAENGHGSRCGQSHALPRILLAEDDYELRLLISQALQARGYEVIEVEDGWRLQQRLEFSRIFFDHRWDFDLMVSDVRMPGISGLEALATLQEHPDPPPVILITAFGDRGAYAQASRLGATAFFDKPIDLDAFCAYVQTILPPKDTNQEGGGNPRVDA